MIEDKDFQKTLDNFVKNFESVTEEAWNLNNKNILKI